jgi:hypothetical protein
MGKIIDHQDGDLPHFILERVKRVQGQMQNTYLENSVSIRSIHTVAEDLYDLIGPLEETSMTFGEVMEQVLIEEKRKKK